MQKFLTVLLLTGAGIAGCTSQPEDAETLRPGQHFSLATFEDCAALDTYLTDLVTDMFVQSTLHGDHLRGGIPVIDDVVAAPIEDGEGAADEARDHTTTNVQEAGVDEPDILKTDGNHSYYILESTLHVIDSWPPETADAIANVPLQGFGSSMFLVSDRIVVFTPVHDGSGHCDFGPCPVPIDIASAAVVQPAASVSMPSPQPFIGVRVTIVDVSNPANPVVERSLDIEGSLLSARLVDGQVYVATNRLPWYDSVIYERLASAGLLDRLPGSAEDADDLRRRVKPIVADYIAGGGRAGFIPDLRTAETREDLFSCSDIMRPGRRSDLSLLSVVAIDPLEDRRPLGSGLMAHASHVYGSLSSLYVAQDSRWWWWPRDSRRFAETDVHQFALNDGMPRYVASGAVPGWIIGSSAFSEHKGHLRVATTDQSRFGWWWPVAEEDIVEEEPAQDANNLFVLKREGNELGVVGEVRGIAPGERIFAVRYSGDRGYLVTFEQIDPLFTLDLADPGSPRISGELHITGFSTYLHPFGDDHLIGVGREGTADGRILGLQLQLFDVADMSRPTRVHQLPLNTGAAGWSASEAEHEPHAFTFYERDNLLALPVTMDTTGWGSDQYDHFSGIIVYRVSAENGFVEQGRISHSGMAGGDYCRSDAGGGTPCLIVDERWFARMRRSAFVEDYLFAFSNRGVTASATSGIDNPVAVIPLP